MNRCENFQRPENPVVRQNFLAKCLFLFTTKIFRTGLKREIEEKDIYDTLNEHKSENLSEQFTKLWNDELAREKPSTMRLFLRAYGVPVLLGGFLFSINETIQRIAQPLCLGAFVSYFAPGQTDISKEQAYYYALGIFLTVLIPVLLFHPFIFFIMQTAMKLRIGFCTLIYKKILKLSKSTSFNGMNGQVINLMTNDVARFDYAMMFIHDLWKGPIEALILGYFIYLEIGISAIIGMAFMLSFIPLQAWIGKKTAHYRLKAAKRTDLRVRFMNEIIQGIQVIKMYAWEKSFALIVDKIRRKEVNAIRGGSYVRASLFSFFVISRISIFLSFVTYVYFGSVITARKVFIVTAFYNILNVSMVHFWPLAITSCAEGYISLVRIQEFLLKKEEKEDIGDIVEEEEDLTKSNLKLERKLKKKQQKLMKNKIEKIKKSPPLISNGHNNKINNNTNQNGETGTEMKTNHRIENVDSEIKEVILKNASAVWTKKEKDIGLFNIDLKVERGKLCAVIGPVGCGKSTLLNVIIGELELDDGIINVNGKISYAPQEPWLFEGSIRNNIIFIEEFDEERYREVCRVCSLERDFTLLQHGDATIVGERGMVLSGGQKARVSLARAVYAKADIYLLDDPLSAVDTHVGKHIFTECIQGFLKNECTILVTHQLQYLKHVQHIVLMDNGRIEAQGNYRQLKSTKENFLSALLAHDDSEADDKEKKVDKELEHEKRNPDDKDAPEEEKETLAEGSVHLDIYKSYIKSVQSVKTVTFVSFLFILSQFAISGIDYFVAKWVNWEESLAALNLTSNQNLTENQFNENLTQINNTIEEEQIIPNPFVSIIPIDVDNNVHNVRDLFVYVYTFLCIFFIYTVIHRNFAFFKMCLFASINLHDKLFRGITRATMNFFNNNPSGRILNRFSKDIGAIDSQLPPALIDTGLFVLEIIAIFILVSIINPWLLLPTCLISLLLYYLRSMYMKTSRAVNRIESLSRSPIFSHTNATIQGLSTIRAYKAQENLVKEFDQHMNNNTAAQYLFFATTRAFACWLDLICVMYIGLVTLSCLTIGSNMGGDVGLIISQVSMLIGMCQWGMRQSAEMENKMVSVERVMEYTNLNPEPPLETLPKYRPPRGWPEYGVIAFNNLYLKYSKDSDYVLKNLTFRIKENEKIGIVGRTGAGKSSIIQALFRLAELEGSIEIDGIDTKTLGLHDLRSKIAIIPQDPILFSGSMRNNLDPFHEKKDDELWNALEQVELKPVISSLAGGLDCKMSDGGSNFSMGQRQLVCLARAILKNNKILILDEATANVDPETDKLIQKTIRDKFAECTVLTIAHRLHTVMDSDRVLVMDAGTAVEFAHPHDLLQRPGGHLRKLVNKTGTATATLLMKIAEDNYDHRRTSKNNSLSQS